MSDAQLHVALKRANDERAARIRRGWYLIGAAFGCFLGFVAVITLAFRLDWFPWWLLVVAVVLEMAAFVCLRFSAAAR